jgi:hypothetical protein
MRSEDLNKIRQMKFEQIINLRKNNFKVEVPVAKGDKPVDVQEAENIKKNGNPQAQIDFIIPTPESGEDEQTFISRCISAVIDEYGQEQAAAICYGQWEQK